MRKSDGAARIDDLLRRYFEAEMGGVRIPEHEAGAGRRRRNRYFRDFMVYAAAAATMAAAVAALPAALRMETPLRGTVARVWTESSIQHYLPGLERVRNEILETFRRRKT